MLCINVLNIVLAELGFSGLHADMVIEQGSTAVWRDVVGDGGCEYSRKPKVDLFFIRK
jgi:hypothetical protein